MTNFDNESKFFLQMQQGNRRAFEYFFKTYVDMLYAYALGYCRDSDSAEDLDHAEKNHLFGINLRLFTTDGEKFLYQSKNSGTG